MRPPKGRVTGEAHCSGKASAHMVPRSLRLVASPHPVVGYGRPTSVALIEARALEHLGDPNQTREPSTAARSQDRVVHVPSGLGGHRMRLRASEGCTPRSHTAAMRLHCSTGVSSIINQAGNPRTNLLKLPQISTNVSKISVFTLVDETIRKLKC